VDVIIPPGPVYRTDRPVFAISGGSTTLHRMAGPALATLQAQSPAGSVIRQSGRFPVSWVDQNGDGTADDYNGDGHPDTFPLVVAQRLDPADPQNLTLASPPVLIFGLVDPTQFNGLGFPGGDPTMVSVEVDALTVTAAFPPVAVDPISRQTLLPPLGKYRVSVILKSGQTWTVPNELERAAMDPLAASQAGLLSVED
jgi:hypothetical protein